MIGYLAIAFLLAKVNIDTPLPELMAEEFGTVFFSALIIQVIIFIVNKFRV